MTWLIELNIALIFIWAVAAVPDGLKAWEILKGRPHKIDLILTEVDLPSISGFALLTLIMEHEMCKNIPVISMIWRTNKCDMIYNWFDFSPWWFLLKIIWTYFVMLQWCPLRIRLTQFTNAWQEVFLTILLNQLGRMSWEIYGSMFGEDNLYAYSIYFDIFVLVQFRILILSCLLKPNWILLSIS